jgi:hypothetical protein
MEKTIRNFASAAKMVHDSRRFLFLSPVARIRKAAIIDTKTAQRGLDEYRTSIPILPIL